MIRLAIICFLISMIRSEDCNFNINDVYELRQLFHDSERRMERATRGQSGNAAIVIGSARSGKSTLINYLMGNALIAYNEKREIKIKKANNNVRGPEIGAGSVSVTTIPTKWNSERSALQNLDFWDTAGFEDNRGEKEDINNAFHMYHLTKKVDSLKLILVISYNDITSGNINQILTLLKTVGGYFNNTFEDIFPSISVIISKAPNQINNGYPVDSEFLNYKLNTNLLSSSELDISEVSKDFVRHIINNNQRVAFFRKVKKVGRVTSDIDDNITQAINNCDSIRKPSHQDIGFTFSVKSKLCLQRTNDDLLNMNDFTDLTSVVNKRYIENHNDLNRTLDRSVLLQKNSSFQQIYRRINISSLDNSDAKFKIKILEESDNIIKDFITKKKLENKISLTEFIDSIIMSGKIKRINILLEAIVEILYDRLSLLISLCQLMLNNIDRVEFNRRMIELKRSQEAAVRKLEEKIRNIEIPEKEKSIWETIWQYISGALSNPIVLG
ncbi:uncharacterized protein LOC122504675 [Leptopilina heterotoma]|uniref:uncharacterized protein LOC122504675 n=1 Tax=Leptopilina heterotoma TaxID=63436 RepID=UPI001CA88A9F|nr:uncharacterized protein LOC122504675 [Leptopilina heterotoma]XP_043471814.1 uncharacterized protein LOC122504675 [Leptopilina heterotoma]